jgi:heptosyltransferase-2
MLKKYVDYVFRINTEIPYSWVIYNQEPFSDSFIKVYKKYIHKYLLLKLGNLFAMQRPPLKTDRILWIYFGGKEGRAIGDTIMELSGRSLLKNLAYQIDLLTYKNVEDIFIGDDIFRNVYTDPRQIDSKNYDYILFTDYSPRIIKLKLRFFLKKSYGCLFEFFIPHGSNLHNQTQFSFAAVNHLFNLELTHQELEQVSRPYLYWERIQKEKIDVLLPKNQFLTISCGGVDPNRIYSQWVEFLHILDKSTQSFPKIIILMGSKNGLSIGNLILNQSFTSIQVISLIDQTSILESAYVISKSVLFIGADGGLMHVAHSTGVKSVTMFLRVFSPKYRLTKRCNSTVLICDHSVNEVNPNKLLQEVILRL